MVDAKKCDVCGEFYDSLEFKDKREYHLVDDGLNIKDLCSNCYGVLSKFIGGEFIPSINQTAWTGDKKKAQSILNKERAKGLPSSDKKHILDLIKSNNGGDIKNLYIKYQNDGGAFSYDTFKIRINKLEKEGLLTSVKTPLPTGGTVKYVFLRNNDEELKATIETIVDPSVGEAKAERFMKRFSKPKIDVDAVKKASVNVHINYQKTVITNVLLSEGRMTKGDLYKHVSNVPGLTFKKFGVLLSDMVDEGLLTYGNYLYGVKSSNDVTLAFDSFESRKLLTGVNDPVEDSNVLLQRQNSWIQDQFLHNVGVGMSRSEGMVNAKASWDSLSEDEKSVILGGK